MLIASLVAARSGEAAGLYDDQLSGGFVPNRPNHFTVAEIWADQKTYDAHVMAGHTRQFRDKLGPMTGSLYDERIYKPVD